MRRIRTPSMAALSAFEAAARHESFTLAARELSLTESAISRQIGVLEENLNVSLFVRVKQRVVLTKSGRLYSEQVRAALRALEKDTLSIAAHGSGRGNLELAVLPTFGIEWLIPRLARFYAQYPSVRINMGVRTHPFSFEEEHFDAAIHHGKPVWPHATSDLLFGETMIVVARGALIGDRIREAADLLKFPLLYSTTRPESWRQWFDAAGVHEPLAPAQSAGFELQSMVVRAAEAGLGIALVPAFFVPESAWRNGLVRAHPMEMPGDDAYQLVYPSTLRSNYALECFRSWILDEARRYVEESGAPAGTPG
ncbi:LysR family transcriptional regulator [Bordetella genomosp. 1]|uniref:LysR family transcriptional regulator n=1 Tax=Bordetella genomosp. 1 TaxID=1395607 RepID=A0A261SSW1_9BORD|nr:LysR substrate-binding domain-containing protein [Bordetella genomosp. 1]OZI40476.1 LysR family transcriptional regulator [Bordetella genomosp. 1]